MLGYGAKRSRTEIGAGGNEAWAGCCVRGALHFPPGPALPHSLGDLGQEIHYPLLSLHIGMRGSQTLLGAASCGLYLLSGTGKVMVAGSEEQGPAMVWGGEGSEAHWGDVRVLSAP